MLPQVISSQCFFCGYLTVGYIFLIDQSKELLHRLMVEWQVTPDHSWRLNHAPSAPPLLLGPNEESRERRDVLNAEPPQWIADSAASACMQCCANFRAVSCGRHHCRFCGGIFCRRCSSGRCLLPVKFRERNPQRVCDVCWERLQPVQRILADRVSNAAQTATHDVTDMSCMRAWINNPLGLTMEDEIYKATNTLRSYFSVSTSSCVLSIRLPSSNCGCND